MPPTVRKQSPADGQATSSPLQSRIHKVSADSKGLRLAVYGRGKTGKTRLAATFPKPLLIIGTEDGTQSVHTIPGIDFIQIERSTEIDGLIEIVQTGKSYWTSKDGKTLLPLDNPNGLAYRSVALDTCGGFQDMLLKQILGIERLPVQKSWGLAKQEHWGAVGAQFKEKIRDILRLAETHKIHCCLIAHERNFKEEGMDDVLVPTIGAALTGTNSNFLNQICDYVGQTYIREQEAFEEVEVDGEVNRIPVRTGKPEYCLRVGGHRMFMTGFRVPYGVTLPDAIPNPTFVKIMDLIAGRYKPA